MSAPRPPRPLLSLALVLILGLLLLPASALRSGAPSPEAPPRREIVVGVNTDYPPYEFLDAKGQPTGYDVDLIRAAAEAMDLPVRIKAASWNEVRSDLEKGRIDALAGMLRSEERARMVDFCAPHLVVHYSIFLRQGTRNIAALDDLRGRRIIVERGGQMHDHLLAQGFSQELVLVDSEPEALALLASGAHDAAIIERLQGLDLIRERRYTNVAPLRGHVLAREICFAVRKGDTGLRSTLNAGLAMVNRTGRQREIYLKWFGNLEPVPWTESPWLRYAGWAAVLLMGATFAALGWTWVLRRQVAQRTRELRRELHERRRTEAALLESETRFRQMAAALDHAFWIYDIAEDRIIYVNPAFERVFGLPEARILADIDTWDEVIHPGDTERVRQAWTAVVEKGTFNEVYRVVRPDGSERWVEDRGYPILDDAGTAVRIAGIAEDITARIKTDEAVRQSQKLESLGVLAGGIAHDFNNLLTALMGNLSLVRLRVGEDPALERNLGQMDTILRRAADLTHQMLAYSGKAAFLMGHLDLNRVAEEMAQLLEVSISKRVQLAFDLQRNLPFMEGDAAQVQQVIMNLVTNASEAIGDAPGRITLATGTEILGPGDADGAIRFPGKGLRPGLHVTLEVRDTGCGMDAQILQRIFDPFFTTKFTGRGLGLSALLGILQGHHGGIAIQSEPGRGSSFRIYFPALEARTGLLNREAPRPAELPAESTPLKILLADDETDVREAGAQLLRAQGHDVVEAADGQEALELFRSVAGDFDLAILDLTMPRMGGRECLEALQRLRPGLPVILCSGYSETEATRSLPEGSARFLPKPFGLEELRTALAQTMEECAH